MSVSAFTKVLVDQIIEAVSYARVTKDLQDHGGVIADTRIKAKSFDDRIVQRLLLFANTYLKGAPELEFKSERQLIGAIAAFLNDEKQSVNVIVEQPIEEQPNRRYFADIVVNEGEDKTVIEIKARDDHDAIRNGATRLGRYMDVLKLHTGILFAFSGKDAKYDVQTAEAKDSRIIHVISAKPQPT